MKRLRHISCNFFFPFLLFCFLARPPSELLNCEHIPSSCHFLILSYLLPLFLLPINLILNTIINICRLSACLLVRSLVSPSPRHRHSHPYLP